MSFKQDIASWDAKDVGYIERLYATYHGNDDFIDTLIGFMSEGPLQRGASWLIKHYVDQGGVLSDEQTTGLFALMHEFDHWETNLHVLQILPSVIIPDALKEPVYEFLLRGVGADAKFVRAWSYGGLIVLSEQDHIYRQKSLKIIKSALEKESASVKARIRQASKKSDYWMGVIS